MKATEYHRGKTDSSDGRNGSTRAFVNLPEGLSTSQTYTKSVRRWLAHCSGDKKDWSGAPPSSPPKAAL